MGTWAFSFCLVSFVKTTEIKIDHCLIVGLYFLLLFTSFVLRWQTGSPSSWRTHRVADGDTFQYSISHNYVSRQFNKRIANMLNLFRA